MSVIDDYFLKKTDKVSFIELKKDTTLRIKNYIIGDNVPLPMVTDTLVNEIREGELEDELKVAHVIEGIIYILGIDYNFKFKDEYKTILYSFNSDIEDFILYRGLKLNEEKYYEDAAIYFRALTNINNKNVNGLFNYALSLERIAKKFIDSEDEEKGSKFLLESTNQLETILDLDPKFALAYYKLGYHYKNYGQFQKSKLIWEKYINLDRNEIRVQEIREQLDIIMDDADNEEGLDYLYTGQYEKALDKFLSLISKHKNLWNLHYLTGLAYKGMGEYEQAIDYFYESIELGGRNVDIYNELGICLFGIGKVNESIDIFNKGIETDNTNYKIVFNRGLIYLQLGLFEQAKADIATAHRLNPDDAIVENKLKELEQQNNQQF
ncbi:tetratricopeptide repeat protein [Schnuerera sp. xch1]|uniref:tetratricopeptide repeat protein n=1 Tax=Schnuerera sp. xch1 TaxID=2874283 RepID=UPI001CBB9A4D|nr:tetratricopeptide repeat protein [Schnuerera sp. xch1]MBZ2175955.1 tetratricopeptide repeat protein [Schnuerera sp. xch1]